MQLVTAENLGRGLVRDVSGQQYHSVNYGDVKAAVNAVDGGGWYIMDGRPVSLLPVTAQGVAQEIGIDSLSLPPGLSDDGVGWLIYLGL